jgi:hypothetical protein
LLIHELEAGSTGATENSDAAETLAYLRAYMAGAAEVEKHGVMALDRPLICSLHQVLMQGHPQSMPGQFRDIRGNWLAWRKGFRSRYRRGWCSPQGIKVRRALPRTPLG